MDSPLAYLNGRLVPFAGAALPLHDAGFVSGATVVDNARTFRRKPFRWPDHLARFRRDCATCYVPLEATDEQLTATAEELVEHNAKLLPPGGELQLVTFATPGPLGFYVGESKHGPPTLGMVTYPLPFARYRPLFTEGATVAAVGMHGTGVRHTQLTVRGLWPEAVLPPTVKHRSRMVWHIADRQAREQTGNPAALGMICENGEITETSLANVLTVVNGVVVSPPRETVLDGISVRVTRELCEQLGVRFVEGPTSLAFELVRVSEMMLTGTGFCLAGVRVLHEPWGKVPWQFDWPGPVFRRLLAAWSDLVGVDVERQFLDAPP